MSLNFASITALQHWTALLQLNLIFFVYIVVHFQTSCLYHSPAPPKNNDYILFNMWALLTEPSTRRQCDQPDTNNILAFPHAQWGLSYQCVTLKLCTYHSNVHRNVGMKDNFVFFIKRLLFRIYSFFIRYILTIKLFNFNL